MTTTHRIGTTAVLILSLAAAGAPAASAGQLQPSRQIDRASPTRRPPPSTAAKTSRSAGHLPVDHRSGRLPRTSAAPPVVRHPRAGQRL